MWRKYAKTHVLAVATISLVLSACASRIEYVCVEVDVPTPTPMPVLEDAPDQLSCLTDEAYEFLAVRDATCKGNYEVLRAAVEAHNEKCSASLDKD